MGGDYEVCSSCNEPFNYGYEGTCCDNCYHVPNIAYIKWFCDGCMKEYEKHVSICKGVNPNTFCSSCKKDYLCDICNVSVCSECSFRGICLECLKKEIVKIEEDLVSHL